MASSDAAALTQNLPWVEKYRPKSINEIAHQEEVISTLRRAVATGASRGDLPHLLLYGPPGTGKTSTALALARDLFGAQNLRARVLELNASDERGIRAVRDRIKAFAATTPAAIKTSSGGTVPCPRSPPPFKLVILDEADAITADAQTALRRTIEAHSKATRFILICNYVSRIIVPLTSRCAKFRFAPLPRHAMIAHLKHIATTEKLGIKESLLEHLVDESAGDLRAAITTLQSAARMSVNGHGSVSEEDLAAAGCALPNAIVEKFDLETSNVSGDARNRAVRLVVDDIVRQGFSAQQLLIQYAEKLLATPSSPSPKKGVAAMNNLQKAAVAKVIAEAEHRLIDGSDEKVQMYDVACRILAIAKNPNDANTLRTI